MNAFTDALCEILDGTFAKPEGELPADQRPLVCSPGTDRLMRNARHAATTEQKLKHLQALIVTHEGTIDLRTKGGRMQWAIKSRVHSDEAETSPRETSLASSTGFAATGIHVPRG